MSDQFVSALHALRDSQVPTNDPSRVTVDFMSLCSVLDAGHEAAVTIKAVSEVDYWEGNCADLLDWLADRRLPSSKEGGANG